MENVKTEKEITIKINADTAELDAAIEKAKQLKSILQEVKKLAASLHFDISFT